MTLYRNIMKYRLAASVILALAGIFTMAYYASCDTACSYLQGDIFGIDLKYIGVAYMTGIIVLALLKQADLLRMLVAGGVGVEVFLVAFQIKENVFCPFCLTFCVLVILMYLVNYARSTQTTSWYANLLYVFGDARIPFVKRKRVPLFALMLIGYLFVWITFSGSATPVYAADETSLPSFGRGSWELIVFTDYFCEPCQSIEGKLEPELERLMARGDVKVTFVDFPGHRGVSALYAKYFLSSIAADHSYSNALKTRRLLFSLAANKKIAQESILAATLKSGNIPFQKIDPNPIFKQWSVLIKRYTIDQTPTCLLRFSSAYTKKYADTEHISNELIPELQKRFPPDSRKP